MVKHGLLMGTSEVPRIFSWSFDKTTKRWKLEHQTPPSMMLSATFAGMKGTKVDCAWSGFADDLFIKNEVPEHTAEAAKDIIMDNAESLDAALAEDRYKQNLRKPEIVPSIRRYGGERRLTALIPFGQVLGTARHFGGRHAFNGSNKAEIECRLQAMAANWAAQRGFWFARSPWSHRRLIFMSRIGSAEITGLDAYAASPGELNGLDKKVWSILTCPLERKGIRNCCEPVSRKQLDQRPASAQVESVSSTSGSRDSTSEMVAGDDGAQPRTFTDNGGNVGTASRRGINVDGRGFSGTNSVRVRSGFF